MRLRAGLVKRNPEDPSHAMTSGEVSMVHVCDPDILRRMIRLIRTPTMACVLPSLAWLWLLLVLGRMLLIPTGGGPEDEPSGPEHVPEVERVWNCCEAVGLRTEFVRTRREWPAQDVSCPAMRGNTQLNSRLRYGCYRGVQRSVGRLCRQTAAYSSCGASQGVFLSRKAFAPAMCMSASVCTYIYIYIYIRIYIYGMCVCASVRVRALISPDLLSDRPGLLRVNRMFI